MLRTILKFDIENLNERIYTKECIERILPDVHNKIKKNILWGTIGFLDSPATISLEQISHKINNLYISDDLLIADIEFIDNKNGNLLLDNLDNYVFRICATGSVLNKFAHIVDLISICAVTKDDDSYCDLLYEYPHYEKIYKNKLLIEKNPIF